MTAVAGTAVASWSALYVTAIDTAAIPVLDWALFTVPVAVACLQTRTWPTPGRPVVTGLLVALPIAAVNAFGWTVYGTWRTGFIFTVVSGGFGVLLGLTASVLARDGSRSREG